MSFYVEKKKKEIKSAINENAMEIYCNGKMEKWANKNTMK